MFLPVKADFHLDRFPWLTALVCIVCFVVYLKQESDWRELDTATQKYCALERSHLEQMVFSQISRINQVASCGEIMYYIANAEDQQAFVDEIVIELKPLTGFNAADSREYVSGMLFEELRRYQIIVPPDPDTGLAYYTDSWNPWSMITASFAHGSWSHIIFNLIFFIAFAAAIEVMIGPLAFIAVILAISIFTGVFTSVSALASGEHFRSLGLSGVVMGMIGLFTYLMPRGKIRCVYWFIVIFGSVAVPAWALAIWFVGGDIYQLFSSDDHGVVNVMAHVTGGIGGYLFGVLFLGTAKRRIEGLQMEIDHHSAKPRLS